MQISTNAETTMAAANNRVLTTPEVTIARAQQATLFILTESRVPVRHLVVDYHLQSFNREKKSKLPFWFMAPVSAFLLLRC